MSRKMKPLPFEELRRRRRRENNEPLRVTERRLISALADYTTHPDVSASVGQLFNRIIEAMFTEDKRAKTGAVSKPRRKAAPVRKNAA